MIDFLTCFHAGFMQLHLSFISILIVCIIVLLLVFSSLNAGYSLHLKRRTEPARKHICLDVTNIMFTERSTDANKRLHYIRSFSFSVPFLSSTSREEGGALPVQIYNFLTRVPIDHFQCVHRFHSKLIVAS